MITLQTKFDRIERVIHISDVHIRKTERHEEYRIVFSRLYERIRRELKSNADTIVVITGDTMHDKTELVPTSIQLFKEMITNLAALTEVIITVGNHDVNIFSTRSLDCIEPMVHDLKTINRIHLLKEDTLYQMSNVVFGLTSIWTDKVTPIASKADHTYIALYHGIIHGCTLDNGMKALNDNRITNSSYFTVSDFDDYDLVMLGDVHKHQYLNVEKTIAYAGSLIQQKRDEELLEHGYIVWDVETFKSRFRSVKSDYGMIQIDLPSDPTNYIDSISKGGTILSKFANHLLPQNLDVKITYDSAESRQVFTNVYRALSSGRKLMRTTESMRSVTSVHSQKVLSMGDVRIDEIEKNIASDEDQDDETVKIAKTDKTVKTIKTVKAGNTTKVEPKQNVLVDNDTVITAILEHHDRTMASANIGDDDYDTKTTRRLIRKQVRTILKKIDYNYETDVKAVQLVSLEFDNMFIYLADNKVDFGMFDKIVGLNAPNYRGKSSFIDVILYAIYGKCSRGKRFDVLNIGRDTMKSRIVVNVNNTEYIILRTSYVASRKARDLKESVTVWENGLDITGDDRVKTHKIIEKKICSYADMINNSFVLQRNGCSFIELTDRQKKDLLCKMARLDVFDRVFQEAKSMHFSYSQSLGKSVRLLDKFVDAYGSDSSSDQNFEQISKQSVPRKIELTYDAMIGRSKTLGQRIGKLDRSSQALRTEIMELNSERSVRETERKYEEHKNVQFIKDHEDYVCNRSKFNALSEELIDLIERSFSVRKSRRSLLRGKASNRALKKLEHTSLALRTEISELKNTMLSLHSKLHVVRDEDVVRAELIDSTDQYRAVSADLTDRKTKRKQIRLQICTFEEMSSHDEEILRQYEHIDVQDKYVASVKEEINDIETQIVRLEKLVHDLSEHQYDPNCDKCMSNPVTRSLITYEQQIDTIRNELKIQHDSLEKNRCILETLRKGFDYDEYHRVVQRPDVITSTRRQLELSNKEIELCQLRRDTLRKEIDALETELGRITENIDTQKQIRTIGDRTLEAERKLGRVLGKIDVLSKQNAELDRLDTAIKSVQNSVTNCTENLTRYESTYDRDATHIFASSKIDGLSKEINRIDDAIFQAQRTLDTKHKLCQKLVGKKSAVDTDIAVFVELKSSIEHDMKYQFITSRIKSLLDRSGLVDLLLKKRVIPFLETYINRILANVGHYTVKIEYRNQSVNIYKSDNLNICMSSGYESYLLDLVFRLSLSMINNHIRTNFLVIDEGFNACDADHKDNVRQLLEYMRSYYSWILIISHDAYIKSFYDHSITIDQIVETDMIKTPHVPYNGSRIFCQREKTIDDRQIKTKIKTKAKAKVNRSRR